MVGELPSDFLRVSSIEDDQQELERQPLSTGQQIQQQQSARHAFAPSSLRLNITVRQARLNKNYGITKMDPYCRIRVGHAVFETHTCPSGGRTPLWNKALHAAMPSGVDAIYIEIFDERSFTMDDRIAWAHIPIPPRVLQGGETVDDWYPLSGKLGDNMEGSINLVMSFSHYVQRKIYAHPASPMYAPIYTAYGTSSPAMMPVPVAPAMSYYGHQDPCDVHPPHQAGAQQPISDADVLAVKDMFPNIESDVVRSVLEANHGDKDAAVNNLLAMDTRPT
jgi:toll-interacting protein